jgi:hypothetical protein
MAYEKRGLVAQVFGVVGLVFGFFLIVGAVFATVAWFIWGSAQDYAANGVDAMGRVEKRWESTRDCTDRDSNVTRTCTDFNVGYSYEVAGKVWHGSGTTDYDSYANLEEGGRIMLRYLAGDPGSSVTSFQADGVDATGGLALMALIFGSLGGVFVLIGGGGLGWQVRGALARVRLRDTGVARGAVVLAVEETNVRVNNRMQWRIRWKDDSGALGQSRGQARENLPEVGTRIVVYADPSGGKAVWEGDSGTR